MTLEILFAALLLFLAVRALARLVISGPNAAATLRVVEIVLLILAIIWLLVFGNIPPLSAWLA